jgi:3D (Asp-Asp-Asp) domain-containing protein
MAVLAEIALDGRELRRCGVVLRARALERIGQLLQLAEDLLRLGAFGADRGVGCGGNYCDEADADPCKNIRRLPRPTNNNPRFGGRVGAPGGAGASRVGHVSKAFGRPSITPASGPARKGLNSSRGADLLWRTVVGSAPVLGQAHTPRRRLLPFVAIAVLVLAAPAVSGADGSRTAALRAHDVQLAAKTRAAVLGLYALDQQFGAKRSQLARLRTQTVELRSERTSLARQLMVARRGTAAAQRQLGARLRLLYEQGNVEPIEIVLGAKNLDEALSNLDNLSRASRQGTDDLRQLQTARARLLSSQHALVARGAALAQAAAAARSTALALAQARSARSAYIGSLASQRRMTKRQIGSLVAQARAAQLRTAQLARVRAASTVVADTFSPAAATAMQSASATAAPTAGVRTITVTATGYSLGGRTASGLPVGWGVVAVDPSVIPLGSHMLIPGYGEAVAADTGGSVVGATIDLWFPTVTEASAWGRRTVTIVLH